MQSKLCLQFATKIPYSHMQCIRNVYLYYFTNKTALYKATSKNCFWIGYPRKKEEHNVKSERRYFVYKAKRNISKLK